MNLKIPKTNSEILKMIVDAMDPNKIKETGFMERAPFDASRQISPIWERAPRGWWMN